MRIVIVEDEIKIRHGLANLIAKQTKNEIIAEAKNGQEGLEWVLKVRPDLVITDIKMPFMDGLALSRMVTKEFPNMKIIILSHFLMVPARFLLLMQKPPHTRCQ